MFLSELKEAVYSKVFPSFVRGIAMDTKTISLSRRLKRLMAPLVLLGCVGDYHAQYDRSIQNGDYDTARMVMQQEIQALALRDYSPTLPLRVGNAYYRLAYAHGKLLSYQDMQHALDAAVSYDPGLTNQRQRMLEHFEVLEFNRGVSACNAGDHTTALQHFSRSLSLIETEDPHRKCAGLILRAMATAAIGAGDVPAARDHCQRPLDLGDPDASSLMTTLKDGKNIPEPSRLQARKIVELRFL